MRLDYLVPLVIALVSLAAWLLIMGRAWLAKPATAREKIPPALRIYRPDRREAYQLSLRRVLCALVASVLCTLAISLALAAWLPLPPLERTLFATLALPLAWPVLLVVLVTQVSRPRNVLWLMGGATLLCAHVLAPSLGL